MWILLGWENGDVWLAVSQGRTGDTERLWNVFVLSPEYLVLKLPAGGGVGVCLSGAGEGGCTHSFNQKAPLNTRT